MFETFWINFNKELITSLKTFEKTVEPGVEFRFVNPADNTITMLDEDGLVIFNNIEQFINYISLKYLLYWLSSKEGTYQRLWVIYFLIILPSKLTYLILI